MIVKDGNALLYSFDHENVRIEPWGRDALRVRVTRNAQFQDETWALLPEEPLQGEIDICEVEPRPSEGMIRMYANSGPFFVGSIRNGKITGKINEYGCLSFFDEVGNVLLEENDLRMVSLPPSAKNRRSRLIHHLDGDSIRASVFFRANSGEKLYGMGQYQLPYMDLKGSRLELARRGTQVTVPFVMQRIERETKNNRRWATLTFYYFSETFTLRLLEKKTYWKGAATMLRC